MDENETWATSKTLKSELVRAVKAHLGVVATNERIAVLSRKLLHDVEAKLESLDSEEDSEEYHHLLREKSKLLSLANEKS